MEASDVTWIYKGIENSIDICAAICKPMIAYALATFRSRSNLGGKIGSLAYLCSKKTKIMPNRALVTRSEMTMGDVQATPRLGISAARMKVTIVPLISIEPK